MAALALTAVGAVGGLVALALASGSPPSDVVVAPTAEDSPSPAPEPEATSRPTQRPAAPGRRVDLGELTTQVAAIRGLPVKRRVRSRLLSGPALARKVSALAFGEADPDEVEADERLLVALRLAPRGIDLAALLEDLYREQILGLYVPEERTLFVKGGRERGSAAQQLTSAHEITHALQDQSFDLAASQEAVEDDSEASLALLSLIEGDAVLTQELWAQRHQTPQQRQDAIAEAQVGGDALARAPEYLRASLFFPYQEGSRFVAELFTGGGFEAVDRAFADPPTTSEQILHPEKFRAGEEAVDVGVQREPGAGWEESATYPLGEFDLHQMLLALGSEAARTASEGWGGGEVRSWTRGADTAVALTVALDTEFDTREVCDAVPRWYVTVADARETTAGRYRGDRDHLAIRCERDRVHVGLAPDPAMAGRLADLG